MEHNVVFPDEVKHACLGIFPPFGVVVAHKVDCIGDIADRRVKPYIEHLPFCSFHRHRDTPVKVAAHGSGLQSHLKPRLALTIYIALPFRVTFQNPFL